MWESVNGHMCYLITLDLIYVNMYIICKINKYKYVYDCMCKYMYAHFLTLFVSIHLELIVIIIIQKRILILCNQMLIPMLVQ